MSLFGLALLGVWYFIVAIVPNLKVPDVVRLIWGWTPIVILTALASVVDWLKSH